jgi:hypothetical protein
VLHPRQYRSRPLSQEWFILPGEEVPEQQNVVDARVISKIPERSQTPERLSAEEIALVSGHLVLREKNTQTAHQGNPCEDRGADLHGSDRYVAVIISYH